MTLFFLISFLLYLFLYFLLLFKRVLREPVLLVVNVRGRPECSVFILLQEESAGALMPCKVEMGCIGLRDRIYKA